jgi:hypothetical protein
MFVHVCSVLTLNFFRFQTRKVCLVYDFYFFLFLFIFETVLKPIAHFVIIFHISTTTTTTYSDARQKQQQHTPTHNTQQLLNTPGYRFFSAIRGKCSFINTNVVFNIYILRMCSCIDISPYSSVVICTDCF